MAAPRTRHAVAPGAALAGAAAAGASEVLVFHPIDTIAKRLMYNRKMMFAGGLSASIQTLREVLFREAVALGPLGKLRSLYPGLRFGVLYKVCQRTYKFAGQPLVTDVLEHHVGDRFRALAGGPQMGKVLLHGAAGSLVGIGEVFLLPLDVLKIKNQTNPKDVAGRSLVEILRTEGLGLYRGAAVTASRNAIGSFSMFGGSALVKQKVFHLEDFHQATLAQNFAASFVGAVLAVMVAAPFDVIKTRIQGQDFQNPKPASVVLRDLLRNERLTSFLRGSFPKVSVQGLQVTFSFTVAQTLMGKLDSFMRRDTPRGQ